MKGKPCVAIAQEVWLSLSATTVMPEWPSHPLAQQQTRVLAIQDPPGSINWRLDDMLSMPFSPQFINYEPSRGFMVPKFTTYDGTSDPFDHIMHYGQLMTLVIRYDALLCKVFLTNLHGQALSWFHRLPKNSVNNFRDLSEAFVDITYVRHATS